MLTDKAKIEKISELFQKEGLELFGFVNLSGDHTSFSNFQQWILEGKHAGMKFMERYLEIRQSPELLGSGLKQSIVYGLPYFQGDKLRSDKARIAQYARMRDYHKTMRKKGACILSSLESLFQLKGRVTVDTAPILERDLAVRTGHGFIGKNTCFIDPKKGSFFLLGAIHVDLDLVKLSQPSISASVNPHGRSDKGGCGTCRRCQVNCPTGALEKDYVLDANKCLSYWTIEHRGAIPQEMWQGVEKYWFGCDICQLACPYNRKIEIQGNLAKESLEDIDLFDVATMDQSYYEETFGGSPMTRAKKSGLQRNALIAMFVTNDDRLEKAIRDLMDSEGQSPAILETIKQINTCNT